jgi:D-serine deaminase-like pyridoxal phosphate-dependent protein
VVTHVRDLWTPFAVLDHDAVNHNIRLVQAWAEDHGFALMPHGKTTMAPELWRRQLSAGAAGLTLATMSQVRTAVEHGVGTVMLANELVSRQAVRWLVDRLRATPFTFLCWMDSLDGVRLLEEALEAEGARGRLVLDVLVELGAEGGRTGARSLAEALHVAHRVAASPVLRLAGVAGYEGALAHDRSPRSETRVAAYVEQILELHRSLLPEYDDGPVVVTVGGGVFFDVVAHVLGPARAEVPSTTWVARPGAYVVHDHGYYEDVSPLARTEGPGDRLRPAATVVAQVLSRPEPGTVYLDAGKRDLPYDEGLPRVLSWSASLEGPWLPLDSAEVATLNDHHAYIRLAHDAEVSVGNYLRLGFSHPCALLDRWREIPEVDADGNVRGTISTHF